MGLSRSTPPYRPHGKIDPTGMMSTGAPQVDSTSSRTQLSARSGYDYGYAHGVSDPDPLGFVHVAGQLGCDGGGGGGRLPSEALDGGCVRRGGSWEGSLPLSRRHG